MPKLLLIMRSVLVQSLQPALTDVVTGTGRRHHFHGKRRAVDMWNYEKRLEYPINIKQTNPALAAMIISQYGGPDGELGASMRYISQRYTMPDRAVAGLLTDIGTEELAHFEMISTMVHQLTRNMTVEQLKGTPFEAYYVDHTAGIWPQAAGGIPFNACEFQSKGDAITDLTEDMAADGATT